MGTRLFKIAVIKNNSELKTESIFSKVLGLRTESNQRYPWELGGFWHIFSTTLRETVLNEILFCFRGAGGGGMFGDVNISAILDSFSISYDKRVRPNYGG